MPGESWITHSVRIKGLDSFTTDAYEEGVHWLRQVLGRGGYTVAFIQPQAIARIKRLRAPA